MSLPRLRVGLTGHRNLPDPELIRRSIETAIDRIEELVPGAFLAGVSSGATGADTIFAEVLRDRDLPWTLLLPFARKKFFNAHDFPGDALARAKDLAHTAEAIVQVTSDSGAPERRGADFLECSLCTVDECDVLLAVWDGQPGGPGGTESAVEHARGLERPLIRINPDSGTLTEERVGSLAKSVRVVLPVDIPSQVEIRFKSHTGKAKWSRPHAIHLNILLVALHQAATFVAIAALIWAGQELVPEKIVDPAAIIKVLVLIFALILPFWLRRRSDDWTDHRMQAEILRSGLCLWNLPNPAKVFEAVRPPAFENMQDELLRERLASPTGRVLSVAEFKQNYLATRVNAQLDYYRRHVRKAHTEHLWLHYLANAFTGVAILLGIVVGLHLMSPAHPLHHYVKLLSISLPLATTTVLAAITARDLKRRMVRYAEMAFFLQTARRKVELATTWEQLSDVVIGVERRLLFEIWEWYSVTRYGAAH